MKDNILLESSRTECYSTQVIISENKETHLGPSVKDWVLVRVMLLKCGHCVNV